MAEKTLKEIIQVKLNAIWGRIKTMNGYQVSEELVELSALLSTLGEKIVEFDQALANKQLEIWQDEPEISAKEMEVRSKVTEEYKNYQMARILEKAMLETIRALKYRIKILEKEKEVSGNL